MASWRNWSEETEYRGLEVYRPKDLQELQEAVRDAAVTKGLQVRAVGAGHSWTHIGLPGQGAALIETDKLNRVLEFDDNDMTVRVEAGARLNDLGEKLYEMGLSLPTMGDTDRQAIGGAVATDTHGSGPELKTISEYVIGMTLVRADGTVYEVPASEMPAARVSLGALGAVYSLTMKVLPTVYLEHERTTVNLEDNLANLDDHFHNNRHVEYWYFPYTNRADLMLRWPTHPSRPRDYPLRTAATIGEAMVLELVGRLSPKSLPRLIQAGVRNRDPDRRRGPAHKILPLVAQSTVDVIKTYTMEYLFDYDALAEAVRRLKASIEAARAKNVYISIPIHIRFVKQSQGSLLSPCVWPLTASFSVNFSRTHEGYEVWFRDFEERMLDMGARTHLGKIHFQPPDLPAEFHNVRLQLDPDERFWNPQTVYPENP